ncbi:MAG: Crp/Fnr family transcriptional regulator [Bryobacteraceae bacterium]|nr:Crp/Fnr family transcriptional regulator [Bryobacteraceae bacterium]
MHNTSKLTFQLHAQCEALRSGIAGVMLGDGARARLRGFRAGGLVWNSASKPDRLFQLRSGRVNIVTSDTRGNEILIRVVNPGEIFGEICLCDHADAPHGTSAVAVSPSEILEAGYEHFRGQLLSDSDMMTSVLRLFCVRLAEADQRVQILAEHDARQRLRKLLAYIAAIRGAPSKNGGSQVSVRITHAELASFGALSRPHLSLLMTEFRDQGLVSYERGSALRIDLAKISEPT